MVCSLQVTAVKSIIYRLFIQEQSFPLISNITDQKVSYYYYHCYYEGKEWLPYRFDHYSRWFPINSTGHWIYNYEKSTSFGIPKLLIDKWEDYSSSTNAHVLFVPLNSIMHRCTVEYKVSNDVMNIYLNANPSVIIHILLQKVKLLNRKEWFIFTVMDYLKWAFPSILF